MIIQTDQNFRAVKNMDSEDYTLYLKGLEEYEKGCYADAVCYFERSNSISEHFKCYERLYCCWLQLGDAQKAFSCIEKAYQLNPRNDKTAYEYAHMLAESKDNKSAQKVLLSIIQRNPSFKKASVLADSIKKNVNTQE